MARLSTSRDTESLQGSQDNIPADNQSSFYDARALGSTMSSDLDFVRTAFRPLGKGTDYPLLNLKRVSVRNNSSLMGKTWRNPITGTIHMHEAEAQLDFALVDLWNSERKTEEKYLNRLAMDKYLFRPVPLAYRTWMYHSVTQYEKDNPSLANAKKPNDWILKETMASSCIDASMTAGRASPVRFYTVMVPIASFTMDIYFICILIFAFTILLGTSKSMSIFDMYKNIRLYTLIPRGLFTLYALIHFIAADPLVKGNFLAALAFVSVIALSVVDLLTGDIIQFATTRLNCTYDVIHDLSGPVYVCRRLGDLERPARLNFRGHMPFEITGLHRWDACPDLSLIADVQGVLCELFPLAKEDWESLADTFKNKPIPYIGLDIYGKLRATFSDELPGQGLVEVSKADSDDMEAEAAGMQGGAGMPSLKRGMSMWSDLGIESSPTHARLPPKTPTPKHDNRSTTPILGASRPPLGKKVACIVEDIDD